MPADEHSGKNMKLFFSATSPYVRKCMAVAHEVGLVGRIELLDCKAHPIQRDASIVAANPLGKVPTLITDDGQVLYDSRVICEYLDHIGGGAVFPKNSSRWQALALQSLADGVLDACLLARYEEVTRPEAQRSAAWVQGQLDKVATSMAALEAGNPALDHTVHIGNLAWGCALGYLDLRFAQLAWRERYPRVAAWWAEFGQRPSMATAWTLA
jgi:glutathione S-transferase